jgi:sugar phosphate isomerase/epimerase
MNLCFSTLGCTDKSLEEIISIARQSDIRSVEIRGIGGIMNNLMIPSFYPENTERTSRLFKENRIRPVLLGTSCTFHDQNKFDKALEEGIASIDIASKLEIPYIRVFGDKLTDSDKECIARVGEGIQKLCEYAKDKSVRVLLEVHGDFNTIEVISDLMNSISSKDNFGLLWDIAHTHKKYGERWLDFYNEFSSLIYHVHIKDSLNGKLVLPGEGDIPITEIVKKMISDGYDGYFSLEWEKKWHPELPDFSVALAEFIKIMSFV